MRFSETPTCRRSAGPVLGGQTREVLEEAGYTPDQIDEMIRLGAVAAG
jgi:crotonobetainyl-CoA:carnitine CoA-transferase CaiB-like acyl-CoA transferase